MSINLELAGPYMHSDRILRNMHQVIRHDLPNQMVALQSLLHFLSVEELNRLTNDGQEYVRRLQNATSRASEMVRFLKQMEQMKAITPCVEEIALDSLGREIQGELLRLLPDIHFEFDWIWNEPRIAGDFRTFIQAVLRLITVYCSHRGSSCRIRVQSDRKPMGVALAFELAFTEPSSSEVKSHAAIEQSLDILLAREWLALSESELDLSPLANGSSSFRVLVNDR